MAAKLTRLVLASLSDLCLETTLNGVDGPSTPTGLACHEKDTVFFREQGVWRFACLASYIFD